LVTSRSYAVLVGGAFAASIVVGLVVLSQVWPMQTALAQPGSSPPSPQELLREGIHQFRWGDYAKAADLLRRASNGRDQLSDSEKTLLDRYLSLTETAASRQAEAEEALKQARAALEKGNDAAAERQASQVLTNPYASSPQRSAARAILNRVGERSRTSAGSRLGSGVQPTSIEQPTVPDVSNQRDLQTSPGPISSAGGNSKQMAQKLMALAVEALRRGDLDAAESLALEASACGARFSHNEVTPQDILQAVNRARRIREASAQTELSSEAKPVARAELPPAPETTAATAPAVDEVPSLAGSEQPPSTTSSDRDGPQPFPTSQAGSETEVDVNRLAGLPPAERKQAARQLLARARQLIESGQINKAERILDQVEQLEVTWGWFEESPSKLRRLARRARIRSWFVQSSMGQRPTEPTSSEPTVQEGEAVPNGPDSPDTAPQPRDARQEALQLLAEARKALQQGRFDEAERLALDAQSKEVHYGLFDDTPERVLADIRRARAAQSPLVQPPAQMSQPTETEGTIDPEVAQIPTTRPEGPEREVRREAARLLAEARRRLDRGDWLNAREIALRVKGWNLHYGIFSFADTPDKVLRAAEALRERMMARQRHQQKEEALRLMAEARRDFEAGRLDEAEAKARQAQQYDVHFGLLEDRPEELLARIEAARQAQKKSAPGLHAQASAPTQSMVPSSQPTGPDPEPRAAQLTSQPASISGALVAETPSSPAVMNNSNGSIGESRNRQATTRRAGPSIRLELPAGDDPSSQADRALVTTLLREADQAEAAGDLETAARKRALAQQLLATEPTKTSSVGREAVPARTESVAITAGAAANVSEEGVTPAHQEEAPGRARVVHHARSEPKALGNDAQRRIEQARELYEQGNYHRSRIVAEQITQEYPEVATEAADLAAQAEITELNTALEVFNAGVRAMRKGEYTHAFELFRQVASSTAPLDPATEQQLQEYLTRLPQLIAAHQAQGVEPRTTQDQHLTLAQDAPHELEDVRQRERIRLQQLLVQTNEKIALARQKLDTNPDAAIAELQQLRDELRSSGLGEAAVEPLVRRVEIAIRYARREKERRDLEQIQQQAQQAAAEQRAREVAAETQRQKEIEQLIRQGEELFEQGRYDEAQVVAERARELDPNNVAAHALYWKAKISRRLGEAKQIRAEAEDGWVNAMNSVDWSAVPYDDRDPVRFPDAKTWNDLTERRSKMARIDQAFRSPLELEIERKLDEPIAPFDFQQTPLAEVIDFLRDATGINIVVDWPGLEMAGITTNHPVTLRLERVRFRSALNLLIRQIGLTYSIRDDVLLISTPMREQGQLIPRVYDVADLVVPVRNTPKIVTPLGSFNATPDFLQQLLQGSSNPAQPFAMPNQPLAQLGVGSSSSSSESAFGPVPGSHGPNHAPTPGQAVDFQSLIELITSTIAPDSWQEVGGAGTIAEFPGNLSLVISQTQDVHDQIRDLLQQLRRLQDLQVVVEVRFITLTEDFLERIGVDFDIDIDDDSQRPLQPFGRDTDEDGIADILRDFDHLRSLTVGLSGPDGAFNPDLDIPFRTGGFTLGRPRNFQTAALNMGIAFLSDIEVFLFLEAVQQDNRSNVLQAPKVTLFNGQSAFVFSGVLRPFVIALIPVVAAGAVAFQPIPTFIFDGSGMIVSAVITADRRYVRLAISPFFFNVVGERRFEIIGAGTVFGGGVGGGQITTVRGELVLPIIGTNIVITSVTVPDGGTVLLGGLKSKTEERKEFGTPILNKVPYINRLFMNTGVGTVTQSLLLMVTPRIVILEEEEQLLGAAVTP
jgi:general secretion pathway protein D